MLYFVHSSKMCSEVSSSPTGQLRGPQTLNPVLEHPLVRGYLRNVECSHEPLSLQSETDVLKESVRMTPFQRQVPYSLPYLHHPIFHQVSRIISVIGIFVVFNSYITAYPMEIGRHLFILYWCFLLYMYRPIGSTPATTDTAYAGPA